MHATLRTWRNNFQSFYIDRHRFHGGHSASRKICVWLFNHLISRKWHKDTPPVIFGQTHQTVLSDSRSEKWSWTHQNIIRYTTVNQRCGRKYWKASTPSVFWKWNFTSWKNDSSWLWKLPLDFDWDTAMERLATLPRQAEWEAFRFATSKKCSPEDTSNEKWKMMTRIFHIYK